MKKVIYTAIIGDIDALQPPGQVPLDWECVCFSDRPLQCPGWLNVVVPESARLPVPRRTARKLKLLSHVYHPDAEITFWMDGNFSIACDLNRMVDLHLAHHDLATFQHPDRDCIYEEAEAVIHARKEDPKVVKAQVARYKRKAYPAHNGLIASCVLLRRHSQMVKSLNERWWKAVTEGSLRDQLSFNYVAHRLGTEYRIIEKAYMQSTHFLYRPHVVRPASAT